MKKYRSVAALAAILMCLSMSACGNTADSDNDNNEKAATTAAADAEDTTEGDPEQADDDNEQADDDDEQADDDNEQGDGDNEQADDDNEENSDEGSEEETADIERLPNAGGVMEQMETLLPKIWGKSLDEAAQLMEAEFGFDPAIRWEDYMEDLGQKSYTYNEVYPFYVMGYRFEALSITDHNNDNSVDEVCFYGRSAYTDSEGNSCEYVGGDVIETIVYAYDLEWEAVTENYGTYFINGLPTGAVSCWGDGEYYFVHFYSP